MRAIVVFTTTLIISGSFGITRLVAGHSANDVHLGASQQQAGDLPVGERHSRPKLSLESALKIAQTFAQREHTDSSSYWLYQAHFILYGEVNVPAEEKRPCWAFRWLNDSDGRAIDIVVSMDGKSMETPSM